MTLEAVRAGAGSAWQRSGARARAIGNLPGSVTPRRRRCAARVGPVLLSLPIECATDSASCPKCAPAGSAPHDAAHHPVRGVRRPRAAARRRRAAARGGGRLVVHPGPEQDHRRRRVHDQQLVLRQPIRMRRPHQGVPRVGQPNARVRAGGGRSNRLWVKRHGAVRARRQLLLLIKCSRVHMRGLEGLQL